jgi:O-antigen ligase
LKSVETHFRNAGFVLIFLMVTPYLTTLTVRMTNALMTAACLVAAISALVNMGAFVLNAPFPHDLSALAGYRLTAVVGMPDYRNSTNISATYAVFFMLATATAVSCPMPRRQRAILFAAAAVLGAGVLFTQARSAMLAVVVGLSVLIAAAPRVRLAIGGGLVAGLIVLLLVPGLREAVMARGGSYRLELWAAFIDLAWQKPLIGHGALANIDRVMADGYVVDQAHNLVLSAQVRGGLLGAVAMATMLAGGIYWAFRHWRATGTIAPLAVVVTMTSAGMLDYQLLSTLPTWPWVTFWLPIGICIGAELAVRGAVKASDAEGQGSPS